MKQITKYKIHVIVKSFIAMFFLWMAVTTIIQRVKNPQLTETQILLKVPKSFMLDWDNAN